MKVVVLTTSYPRHDADVAGLFVRDAVEAVRARGVEVEVVSPSSFRHFGIAAGHGIVGNLRARPWLVAFCLGFVGWAWENWAYVSPSLPISTNPAVNPTNRTVGSLVLLSIVAAPLLIGKLLGQRDAVPAAQAERFANTTGSASASATNA